ncbi:MAG: LCP family protein, partial [Spirochaetota bacterium]
MGLNISDVKYSHQHNRKSDFDWVSLLLIFLAIGIVVGAVLFIFHLREGKLAQMVEDGKTISGIIIENNSDKTETVFLGYYNPTTAKAAYIMVPRRTFLKTDYPSKPEFDTVRNIYSRGGVEVLTSTFESLTGHNFDYYLVYDLKDVEKLVDLLGGVDVYIQNSIDYLNSEENLFIQLPQGKVHLDGAKSKELLLYRYGSDGLKTKLENHRVFLESLLDRTPDILELTSKRRVMNTLLEDVETNLSEKDMDTLLQEARKLDSSRLLVYRMYGREITINKNEYIAPVKDGKWLQERIARIKKFLADSGPAPIGDEIKIEILNGSGDPGRAHSLRNYFLKYG